MSLKVCIHDYEKRLQGTLKGIEKNDQVSKTNKHLLIEFKDRCFSENLSAGRINRYLQNLKKLCIWLDKDWDKVDKKDIERLVGIINKKNEYSAFTKQFYKVTIKKFFRFVKDVDIDNEPPEVRWIKTTIKQNEKEIPKNYPTEEDIKKVVDAATHPRDKAFVTGLYESGCRVSEWATLQIKDIEFEKTGLKVTVKGKTGERKILLILTLPVLKNWLSVHPQADNPNAPLWVNYGSRGHGEPLEYGTIRLMLKRLGAKAGLLKKVHQPSHSNRYFSFTGKVDLNPHNFRHARATVLANFLTEAQMNAFFGWRQGSSMPSIYVHLSGKDIDNAVLRYYGIETEEENGKDKSKRLRLKVCPKCETENKGYVSFCSNCGIPLDVKRAVEVETVMEDASKMGRELLESGSNIQDEFKKLSLELVKLQNEVNTMKKSEN